MNRTRPAASRSRRSPVLPPTACALLALLAACGGGGGGGRSAPAPVATLEIAVATEAGAAAPAATGIELLVGGESRRLVVLERRSGDAADVTGQATLRVADSAVAAVDGASLAAVGIGSTEVVAEFGTLRASTAVHGRPAAAIGIEQFGFDRPDELVCHDAAPRQLTAVGRLTTGEHVEVTARLAWRTADPAVATVTAAGLLQPVADGSTWVIVREPRSGAERVRVVQVALPRPSGSLVGVRGGRITNGDAAVWVPPFALPAPVPVAVEPVAAAGLPIAVPAGRELLAAVRFDVPAGTTLAQDAVLQVAVPTDTFHELAQVMFVDPFTQEWRHLAWVTANELGLFEWITWFSRTVFAVFTAPGQAEALAARHAPTFVLANTDIGPISTEELLRHCDLWTTIGPVALRESTAPAVADLLGVYNHGVEYLMLDDDGRRPLRDAEDWGLASAGGMRRRGAFTPTVYWSVRVEQERGRPLEPSRSVVVVKYWLLYAASSLPWDRVTGTGYSMWHDGDLEFCQVLLDGRQEPPVPIGATASQHYYGEARAWADVAKVGERPRLFVAKGAHATYFERGFGGVGNVHGTELGNDGFLGKISSPSLRLADDHCATAAEEVELGPAGYRLTWLDGPDPGASVLRSWRGTLDRGSGAVPMVPWRHPQEPQLAMQAHGLAFHYAYDFSTANSIAAFAEIATADVGTWTGFGRRMFELQRQTALAFPGEPVQPRIDGACAPQPEHLAAWLQGSVNVAPATYFACDDWRLLDVRPASPMTAAVGTPLRLTVSWAGLQQSTLRAIVHPLRVVVLPAVDLGAPSIVGGSYQTGGVTRWFTVQLDGLSITEAAAGASSVDVDLRWIYREDGVEVPVPAEALASPQATSAWRLNLFVRDAADVTLYHTVELQSGSVRITRDGPPLDVTVSLAR
jgi:hypothetical protein